MTTPRAFLILAATSLLAGCVSLQPTVLTTAAPVATSGYVALVSERNDTWGYGFGLVDTATGRDYVLRFGELSSRNPGRQREFTLIELPPGEYRLGYWVTFGWLLRQQSGKKEIPAGDALGRPFRVEAGKVLVLGHVLARTEEAYRKVTWNVSFQKAPEAAVLAGFRQAYPAFADARVECLTCVRDAPRAAAPARDARPGPAAPARGKP